MPSIGTTTLDDSQQLPRNIYDNDDFQEDCAELPPGLPDSEPTQVSYLLAKANLAFGFARALHEIKSSGTIRRTRVLEMDRELRCIYDGTPEYYKLGPFSGDDSLVLVSARFVLASIHHISLCVLHSRFLELARSDRQYEYSRRVCLTSAMAVLRFQAIQNQDIPIDGHLRSLTEYQTSLAIHHHLLAATLIASEVSSSDGTSICVDQQHCIGNGVPTRTDMIKALALCARIFRQTSDRSIEAFKAADILQMLVEKFESSAEKAVPGARTNSSKPKSSPLGNASSTRSPAATRSTGNVQGAARATLRTPIPSQIERAPGLSTSDTACDLDRFEPSAALSDGAEPEFFLTSALQQHTFADFDTTSWSVPANHEVIARPRLALISITNLHITATNARYQRCGLRNLRRHGPLVLFRPHGSTRPHVHLVGSELGGPIPDWLTLKSQPAVDCISKTILRSKIRGETNHICTSQCCIVPCT
jgi:hypothetical protein